MKEFFKKIFEKEEAVEKTTSEEEFEKLVQTQSERLGEIWEIKQDEEDVKIIIRKEGQGREKSLESVINYYLLDIEDSKKILQEQEKRGRKTEAQTYRDAIQFDQARLEALDRRLKKEIGKGYPEILGSKSYIKEKLPSDTVVKVRRGSGQVEDGWRVIAIRDLHTEKMPEELNFSIEVHSEGKIKWIQRDNEKIFADFRALNNI